MKLWQRRVLGALTLGGGFLGIVSATGLFLGEGVATKLIGVIVVLLYGFGMWCGLLLLENSPECLRINRAFWLIQTPYFMSPLFGYYIGCGAYLYLTFSPGVSGMGWQYQFGSRFEFSLLQTGRPIVLGFNVLAILIIIFLTREIRSKNAFPKEPIDCAAL